MKEGEDFKFRTDLMEGAEKLPIELLVDEFKGVVYYYTNMVMGDEINEDGSGNLSFQYVVIEDLEKSVIDNPRFEQYIGLVLNQMLLTILEDANATGIDNTTESDTE